MNPDTTSIDLTSIAVALGRIEAEVKSIRGMDERLRKVETDLTELKARQQPKTPWYVIAGGISGIGSIIISTVAILTIIVNSLPG